MNLKLAKKVLICPSCQGSLSFSKTHATCTKCSAKYQISDGIIDFSSPAASAQVSSQAEIFDDTYQHLESYTLENWQSSYFKRVSASFEDETNKDAIFMDIGSGGNAYNVIEMAKKGHPSIGLDISPQAAKNAERFAKDQGCDDACLFIVADASNIPIKAESIAHTACIMLLEHIEDDEAVIRDISRILKPNASSFIAVPNAYRYIWPIFWPLNRMWDKKLGHVRHYTPEDLSQKFRRAGFSITSLTYTGHLIKFVQLALSFITPNQSIWWLCEKVDQMMAQFKMAQNINAVFTKVTKSEDEQDDTFQKNYFTDYYQPMTGSFSKQDLEKNMRWFYGWFNAVSDWYPLHKGSAQVLEIGCAIGAAGRILAERGFVVTATDVSEYAISKARAVNHHQNLQFETLDIQSQKLPNKKYDLIIGFEVIEHLDNLDQTFKNLHSLLAKGGTLIVSTPYPATHIYRDSTHINVRHPIDWTRRLEKAGFTNIKTKRVSFLPFFYNLSKNLHVAFPIGLNTRYINSPVFLYAENH